MQDRRKHPRYPVSIQLNISDLFRQDRDGIHDLCTPIEVKNISRGGICFVGECILPIGYCVNASLQAKEDGASLSFPSAKILRAEVVSRTKYRYGCEFTSHLENVSSILHRLTG